MTRDAEIRRNLKTLAGHTGEKRLASSLPDMNGVVCGPGSSSQIPLWTKKGEST